ncbi:erythromycin esterase family protein [Hymenobacter antarcticus]|uniref:Erythromycin esterase family protein n=1 Tax=Hymenobacter antarcticus TaxID=486270 RepID=A0ABP7QY45_9BACT
MFITKGFSALLVLLTAGVAALAQSTQPAPALAYQAIRTIDPQDPDFTDLTFLKAEFGAARVVLLGEPTHGEGNVFGAKIRLVRYLRQLGFTTVAFESGFYELSRAQQDLEAGKAPAACFEKSLFPIWSRSQEFQPMAGLVGPGKLKVAGFDPQFSGEYGEELVEDLQAFLRPEKGADAVPYDYLEEVMAVMGQHYTFSPAHEYSLFNLGIGKATKLLQRVAATSPARKARAEFWLQCLGSVNTLARDYAHNDPGAKGETGFKAKDSNVRDRLMAENLLWYLRQHPAEKVICWGATPHFAGSLAGLQSAELQAYRPMGFLLKAALPGQVYVLGTATAHGVYGNVYGPRKPVPAPAPGSLESQLDALGPEYLFVRMQQPALAATTASLFEYTPVAGNWTAVVDGLLFLKTVHPPTEATTEAPLTLRDSVRLSKTSGGPPAAAKRRVTVRAGGAAGAVGLSGRVLNEKTRAAVPFASVYLKKQGLGLVTNIKGEFELPRPAAADTLVATCLGFGARAVSVGSQTATGLTLLLPPQAYALAGVQVSGESLNPRKIMERVIKNLPKNYLQQDYNADVYARASSTNYDSLLYDVEYFSTYYDAQGYRSVGAAASRLEEVKWNQLPAKGTGWEDYHYGHSGYFAHFADLVDENPLFQARTLGKYTYSLGPIIEYEGRETLVVEFVARKKTRRTTGDYFDQGYTGKLYINHADYAVTRCEVEWARDTVRLNQLTRKYFARSGAAATSWHSIHRDYRIRQTITYQQQPDGHYFVNTTAQEWIEKHKNLATGQHMEKLSVLSLQFTNIRTAGVAVLPERPPVASMLLKDKPLHEEFWRTHQRPSAVVGADQLKASKQ